MRELLDKDGERLRAGLAWKGRLLWPERFDADRSPKEVPAEPRPYGTKGSIEEKDGWVRLRMNPKKGKLSDAGYDQMLCWHARIPADRDVTVSAILRIHAFLESGAPNYQEGFGIFLRDTLDNHEESGYAYSNMAAVGGMLGGWNLLCRTGITADSVEQAQTLTLFDKAENWRDFQVTPQQPRTIRASLSWNGRGIRADVTDETGTVHYLSRGKARGGFQVRESGCMARLPRDLFSQCDKKYAYVGFFVARGCDISIPVESIRVSLSRRKGGDAPRRLFASPDGACIAAGSRKDPLDLQTALENVYEIVSEILTL